MVEQIQILLVANDGKGGVVNHPAQFGYPKKKKMAERWFFNTGRYRVVGGNKMAVFTEEGFNLNLDDFADAKEDVPEEAPAAAALEELDKVVDGIVGIYGKDSSEYQSAITEIAEWHNKHLHEEVTQ